MVWNGYGSYLVGIPKNVRHVWLLIGKSFHGGVMIFSETAHLKKITEIKGSQLNVKIYQSPQ